MHHAIDDVSVDVVQQAIMVAENAPDPREDRVEQVLGHLDSGVPDSRLVAQALISSVLAESSR